jgi:predicted RecB family nuclease
VEVSGVAHALSKSRFQLGLQCQKLLWLKCRRPELADPITELQQHIFDTGTHVGVLARERFGGGMLVAEDHTQSSQALETTARLMADPPAAIFEAAFVHGGVFVRPDALVRAGDAWDLYEVKSGTKVKPENVTDVAVQVWVLEGAGLKIRRAYLMHLDNTYVYAGGDYDLGSLFAAEDVTADVRVWVPAIPDLVAEMLAMLDGPEPERRIGKHCDNPYTCAFYGYCHASLPERAITQLPRVTDELIASLLAAGIQAIDDIPPHFPGLTTAQRTVCETLRRGTARFDPRIEAVLGRLSFPIHFLDFETMQPALPLYPGTRTWQQVPFQWSDHILEADGMLRHCEFIAEADGDPRPAFVASMLEALGEEGSVVAYHASFEDTRLRELAAALPAQANAIERVRARLFDLEKPVRDFVQHPELLGRSSIKVVLPALVEGLGYDGLDIREGGTASLRYLRCALGVTGVDERAKVLEDLRAYCATDTLAMVELYRTLRREAGA